ncbi:MAG: HEPN domain-containing protein [Desulfotomaculaceae bacterium]|nr:HEPN domain-containing protein [Desulfotomaculaceae bacterium]
MNPLVKEWLYQAEYDLETARSLYHARRYIYTVFMCHLSIEKALKAFVVKITEKAPPKTHNLIVLLKLGNALLTTEQINFISRLSLAGIITRYPEDLKQAIGEYPRHIVIDYLKRTEDVIKCLKQQIE